MNGSVLLPFFRWTSRSTLPFGRIIFEIKLHFDTRAVEKDCGTHIDSNFRQSNSYVFTLDFFLFLFSPQWWVLASWSLDGSPKLTPLLDICSYFMGSSSICNDFSSSSTCQPQKSQQFHADNAPTLRKFLLLSSLFFKRSTESSVYHHLVNRLYWILKTFLK